MGELNERLSRISTQWMMVFQAHGEGETDVSSAQRQLLERYSGAVYRYLLGAVRDADVAEELAQEFALRFVRGDFRRADPERGRFRDYLKTAVIHLVTDYHRSRQAAPIPLASQAAEVVAAAESIVAEPDFLANWREELLQRTWRALAQAQPDYHAILLHRVENPDATSAQAAEELQARLQKPISAAAVRKAVQRAHTKFAELLVNEVAASLDKPTPEELVEELRALDLLKYCKSAVERRNPMT